MGIMRYSFFSQALNLCTDVTITYPDRQFNYAAEPAGETMTAPARRRVLTPGMRLPVLYVLHGGSDDDTLLHRYTNLERYADEKCIMTVTPQAKDSFFIDTEYGFRYFTYVTEELPRVMESLFAASPRREDKYVLGMAMGGNAALMLAMKRPEAFSRVIDLSGGIGCSTDSDWFEEEMRTLGHIRRMISAFGDPAKVKDGPWDIGRLARQHAAEGTDMPEIYMAVGEDDFIRDVVRKDRDALKALGMLTHYEEAPGYGHEWGFWDLYIGKAIRKWLPETKETGGTEEPC